MALSAKDVFEQEATFKLSKPQKATITDIDAANVLLTKMSEYEGTLFCLGQNSRRRKEEFWKTHKLFKTYGFKMKKSIKAYY